MEAGMCYPVAAMPEPSCAVASVAYAVSVAAVTYPVSVPVVSVAIMSIPNMPSVADVRRSVSVAITYSWRIAIGDSRRVVIAVNRLFVVAVGIGVAATIAAIGSVVRSGDSCTDERAGGKP
jgi:hypothetical protein